MATIYRIRVKGHLEQDIWSTWLSDLTISNEPTGEAVLSGPLVDQGALHGVLARLRDLGIPLIAVTQAEADEPPGE